MEGNKEESKKIN